MDYRGFFYFIFAKVWWSDLTNTPFLRVWLAIMEKQVSSQPQAITCRRISANSYAHCAAILGHVSSLICWSSCPFYSFCIFSTFLFPTCIFVIDVSLKCIVRQKREYNSENNFFLVLDWLYFLLAYASVTLLLSCLHGKMLLILAKLLLYPRLAISN